MAEARAEGVDITTEIDDDTASTEVRNDRDRLTQILANLLSNAIKFTRSSVVRRVTVRVNLTPTPVPPVGTAVQLHITVRDTGIGISANAQTLLFQRFGRVGEASSAAFTGGSGLGLSICKLIVDLMGGHIRVESTVGRGTTYHVTVPCEVGPALAPPPVASSAVPLESTVLPMLSARLCVLVVEDNIINQAVLKRQLPASSATEGIEFEVVVASNGQETVDAVVQGNLFDVILMDIQMPVLDGIGATVELRWRGCNVPIIGLSGNARQEQMDMAIAAGMQAYLTKPYDRKDLINNIRTLCLARAES